MDILAEKLVREGNASVLDGGGSTILPFITGTQYFGIGHFSCPPLLTKKVSLSTQVRFYSADPMKALVFTMNDATGSHASFPSIMGTGASSAVDIYFPFAAMVFSDWSPPNSTPFSLQHCF